MKTVVRRARVVEVDPDGAEVELLDGPLAGAIYPARLYTEFGDELSGGSEVLVNTVGVEMGLGTGGVVIVLPPSGGDAPVNDDHFVKLPYTPLQFPVVGEQLPSSLGGVPTVVLPLHSHLPVACCAVRELAPDAKVAFVWHEGGALATSCSALVAELRRRRLLHLLVSAGNCFGGDREEPNIYAGLLAASDADVVLVGIGPGVTGSGRAFAHGGMSAAVAANAAVSLGGRVVFCPRVSGADARERHRGVSHHTVQALGATLAPLLVALPDGVPTDGLPDRHDYVYEEYGAAGLESRYGLTFESMGRSYHDDEVFFDAAAAAASVALRKEHREGAR